MMAMVVGPVEKWTNQNFLPAGENCTFVSATSNFKTK